MTEVGLVVAAATDSGHPESSVVNPIARTVRYAVYATFRERGMAPSADELSHALSLGRAEVVAALQTLAAEHSLTLRPVTDEVWMAHPFSAIETRHVVSVGTGRWFANCVWDGLAILALFGDGVLETRSPETGETLRFASTAGRVEGEGLVHFLVPARRFWEDIGYT
jgi:hypothetical protein